MSRHGASTPFANSGISRNFDFPPATNASAAPASFTSNLTSNTTDPTITSPFQRDLLQRNRRERSNIFDNIRRRDHWSPAAPMPPRRRRSDRRTTDQSSHDDSASLPEHPPPSRLTPTDRVRENHVAQMRRRRRERDAENAALFRSLQEASHTLDGIASMVELANSNHQHQPSTRTLGRSVGNTFPMSDVEDASSTRLKRRKLDHSHDEPAAFNGFSYGHFGQVVPGRLRMEIVSCDGGEYADADSRSVLYRPENILRNDRSVYCTKSSECNILLQHQGGTTFCVEQIVIRAPRKGFTAPVQEGLIFVGMSADELTEQSSRYEITQHESRHCDPWSPELTPDDEPISLLQSLQDPEVWEGSRQRQSERAQADFDRAERDQAWTRRRMEQMYVSRHDEPSQSLSRSEENCDWLLQDHTAHASDANPDDSYAIDPVTDDDSSDVDEESSTAVIADRMRRDARAQDDTDFDVDYTRQWRETRDRYGYARSIRRSEPRQIEPRADSGKTVTLPPSAKFFMEKNKITVKFPTPLSAKYILLKFYSSRPQGNIDVQSVVTYGFAGPRYFPACEMR